MPHVSASLPQTEIGACDKYNVACNCDAMDGMGRSDVAVFTDPKKIPLTSMVFLAYNQGLKEESEGRFTLGPLKCEKEGVFSISLDPLLLLLVVMVERSRRMNMSWRNKKSRRRNKKEAKEKWRKRMKLKKNKKRRRQRKRR